MAKQVPSPKFEQLRIIEIRLEYAVGNPGEPYKKLGISFKIEKLCFFVKKCFTLKLTIFESPGSRGEPSQKGKSVFAKPFFLEKSQQILSR